VHDATVNAQEPLDLEMMTLHDTPKEEQLKRLREKIDLD
jgi:hypothetical protein